MACKGTLFIISGPSGAGKGTLVDRVLSSLDQIKLSVSATTRLPRPNEQNGREYHFISEEEFSNLLASDGFLEWASVHGNRYGTLSDQVNQLLASGSDLILEIDVQGRDQVISRMPQAVTIFVAPPSIDVLEKRLRYRGDSDEEDIQRRLETAKVELAKASSYDHLIVNDNLPLAVKALEEIITSYRPAL